MAERQTEALCQLQRWHLSNYAVSQWILQNLLSLQIRQFQLTKTVAFVLPSFDRLAFLKIALFCKVYIFHISTWLELGTTEIQSQIQIIQLCFRRLNLWPSGADFAALYSGMFCRMHANSCLCVFLRWPWMMWSQQSVFLGRWVI